MHGQDWASAERVAMEHDEESLSQVLHAQAKQAFLNKDYQAFEALMLRAQKPELIIKQYQVCFCNPLLNRWVKLS